MRELGYWYNSPGNKIKHDKPPPTETRQEQGTKTIRKIEFHSILLIAQIQKDKANFVPLDNFDLKQVLNLVVALHSVLVPKFKETRTAVEVLRVVKVITS